ncbi:MAG: beta-lactamase family protein [Actinobacteria bacterium]|nr:beta-lactamase family protein [Actinomycetota bacterium]
MATISVDPSRIDALLTRVRREVDDGLLPAAQVAVAIDGEIVVDATFGAAEATRFIPYSATKALTVAAIWRLIGDAGLDVSRPVASYLPSFGENGKDGVTIEQVLLHTGGFPMAPLGPSQWRTHADRCAAYADWQLEFPPGERYVYHPVSAHWVLCDIIEEVTGDDYREVIQRLVTDPLGLPRLLGIPLDEQDDIAEVVGVGEAASIDELAAAFGDQVRDQQPIPTEIVLWALTSLNHPKARAQGVPGGGAVVHAADLAMLYQGLLHNPGGLWDPQVLADGTGHVRSMLPDPSGVPASRTLGLVVAGDDGFSALRGFGTVNSPRAFGHNGAGGQLAFADPATGLSGCYVTSGLDQNLVREFRRNTEIADAMLAVAP